MDEFSGIEYPHSQKTKVGGKDRFGNSFGPNGEVLPYGLVETAVSLTDRQFRRARQVLGQFASAYKEDRETQGKGWAMVRDIENPDGGFRFATDPLAPRSVVVRRPYELNAEGKRVYGRTAFFYISEERDNRGVPLVFLWSDSAKGRLLPITHRVLLVNNRFGEGPDATDRVNKYFTCRREMKPGEVELSEIQVWYQGQLSAAHSKNEVPKTRMGPFGVQLAPVPPIPNED